MGYAQGTSGGPIGKTKSTAAASAKNSQTADRRYALTRGDWSAATVSLFNTWSALDDNPNRRLSFYSPDHQKIVKVIGSTVTLVIDKRSFETDINSESKHDAELGWAPDSTKFFVTWSESGELGPWHMQVYGVDRSGLHEFPKVEETARRDFEQLVRKLPIDPELNTPEFKHNWDEAEYCEPYHVIGGRWLNGSKEILLSVLIRNTGDCRYSSDFNVYRVNGETGEVLQRFTAAEGHRRFGDKYLPIISP
ncbi:hypothetical protein ACFPT7_18065 [Acidicapsa dinghuensis]|uniref:Uncharacterized protein n=1 Tax=Acidicapsa dinghuensis TaxID=2218256 RepID=A0ABW1EIW4_9BACT|nr:hypothetical protein [Acidicapsa dinghuensis]